MIDETIVKLKEILEYSGWTQEKLASKLEVSFSTLNAWLNNKSAPHKSSQEKIETVYGQIVGYQEVDEEKLVATKKQARSGKCLVGEIIRDRQLLDDLTLHLTYHTNGIEGSTMTIQDVREVLEEDKVLANKTATEQLEARNHRAALYFLLDELDACSDKLVWSEELIRQIHVRLMNGLVSNAGSWRQHGVRINGSVVSLEPWEKVPLLMHDLVMTLNEPSEDIIDWMARCHSRFETIHPFSDGNGRMGRLILLAQALNAGYWPPVIAKQRKKAYYWYLEMAQLDHNYRPLSLLLAESMIAARETLQSRETL